MDAKVSKDNTLADELIERTSYMMDAKVSKDHTLADELIERTSSMLDEIESKTMYKDEEGDQWRKKK